MRNTVSLSVVFWLSPVNLPAAQDSDIIYLNLPKHAFMILGSTKAAMDLFDKRSHIYSDRVHIVMMEMYVWGTMNTEQFN